MFKCERNQWVSAGFCRINKVLTLLQFYLVMDRSQKILTRVGSAIIGFGLDLEISPKNLLPLDQKILFRLGQKVPGSKIGKPLFNFGSKVYAWVGSELISGAAIFPECSFSTNNFLIPRYRKNKNGDGGRGRVNKFQRKYLLLSKPCKALKLSLASILVKNGIRNF